MGGAVGTVAYGGAGPLHASLVARELNVRKVIIPRHPGHFCAYGMLYASLRYDVVQTSAKVLNDLDLDQAQREFSALEQQGRAVLDRVGIELEETRVSWYADMRYEGQEHTIKIRLPALPRHPDHGLGGEDDHDRARL